MAYDGFEYAKLVPVGKGVPKGLNTWNRSPKRRISYTFCDA